MAYKIDIHNHIIPPTLPDFAKVIGLFANTFKSLKDLRS